MVLPCEEHRCRRIERSLLMLLMCEAAMARALLGVAYFCIVYPSIDILIFKRSKALLTFGTFARWWTPWLVSSPYVCLSFTALEQ